MVVPQRNNAKCQMLVAKLPVKSIDCISDDFLMS